MELSPTNYCSCVESDMIRGLFPAWASDDQVSKSLGYDKMKMPVIQDDFCAMDGSAGEAPADFDWSICASYSGLSQVDNEP